MLRLITIPVRRKGNEIVAQPGEGTHSWVVLNLQSPTLLIITKWLTGHPWQLWTAGVGGLVTTPALRGPHHRGRFCPFLE